VRFRVQYDSPADLVADAEQQFDQGGFLVRVEAPDGAQLYAPAELEIVTPDARVVLEGQIVQTIPGVGVAIGFAPDLPVLVQVVEAARAAGGEPGKGGVHSIAGAEEARAPREESTADRIQLALHGNRDERMRIIRGANRSLHRYVLQNPGLQLDEVTQFAKMSSVSPDLLAAIADRREWAGRPEIALAMVRNPKTPVPLAIRMLNNIAPADLRRLAKGTSLRMPILSAARKKVIGD
jgi:hypothetical protein